MPKNEPVSTKNTKKEILDAYQDLLGQLQQHPADARPVAKLKEQNTLVYDDLGQQVDQLSTSLKSKLGLLISQFDQAVRAIETIQTQHQNFKRAFEQEQIDLEKQRRREGEEYKYEFEKTKKRLEEELAETKRKTEVDIQSRKEALKSAEDELVELRAQVAQFDKRLAEEIKKAITETESRLQSEFKHHKELAEHKAKAEVELLKQQVTSLESLTKEQKDEIKLLQTSVKEAAAQVTKIAEKAVSKAPVSSAVTTKSE